MYQKMNQNFNLAQFGTIMDDILSKGHKSEIEKNGWTPPINIIKGEKEFVIEMAIPGIAKEVIKLEVKQKELVVKYDHTKDAKTHIAFIKQNFKVRSFERIFKLSDQINTEEINAQFENGVLTITLNKKEKAIIETKSIKIQ
jgi:HSP20 family protein